MKLTIKPIPLAIILIVLSVLSCSTKKDKPDPNLAAIELFRGDIALCGNPEFGKVSFPISCDIDTRENFDLAISLLHSFEYKEAEKSFVKIIDADPSCAMAYWGVAMSLYHSLWFEPSNSDLEKGSQLLAIANKLDKSTKEQEYLEAIGAFYKDYKKISHSNRQLNMERKMEAIYLKYKFDTEAAIFYALALNSTADPLDKTYVNQLKAGKILEELFPTQPNHPGIAHYIIHNYDNPTLAHLALSTARKYAVIAPSSAHAQHMPSHIFTRLGLWNESINSNLDAAASAVCYSQAVNMKGIYFEETHAMDYLVYAYLQQGRNDESMAQLTHLNTMDMVTELNKPATAYAFAAIPVRIALENKQWRKAALLELHNSDLEWSEFPWQKSMLHFARALGAAHNLDFEACTNEIAILQTLQNDLVVKKDKYGAKQVLIQINAAKAWLAFAHGDVELATKLMIKAADMEDATEKHPVTPCEVIPARELLGDMLLAMNKPSDALIAYELDLKVHPNRFNALYGAAVASKNIGDQNKALAYYKNLLKLSQGYESARKEIMEAEKFIEKQRI